MIFPALFFYLFAGVCVASAVMVIVSRNPVHSVLFLILAFVNAAGLFVLMGAEFLAMILVVVYVGAVAVLFLFVIMMLDVDFAELREGFIEYLPIGLVIGGVFLAELLLVGGGWVISPNVAKSITAAIPANVSNTEALGLVAGGMDDAGFPVDRHFAVAVRIGIMFDLIAARMTRMRTDKRDQACDDRADERQKDDGLDHWRASSRTIAAQTRPAFAAGENRFRLFRIMP